MNNSINLINREKFDARIYKDSLCLIPYAIFSLLALLSTVHFVFSIFNFGLCGAYIILSKKNKTIPFLIYITYFASIFKILEISEVSLYTLLLLIFVIKEAIKGRFKVKFLIALTILAIFVLSIGLIKGPINIQRNIKFFEFFFYVYIVVDAYFEVDSKLDCSSILKAVIFGVLISSTFRFMDCNIFSISKFVGEKSSSYDASIFTRFSGLLSDPNYYAVNVLVAMISTLFLGLKRKIHYVFMACLLAAFAGLAILTGSKSAILMLIIPFALLLYTNHKLKIGKLNIALILGVVVLTILMFAIKNEYFSYLLLRFGSTDLSLDSFTTGRTAIWRDYNTYFSKDTLDLIFGSGISTLPLHGHAAHNTYIDVLYYLGIIPGAIFTYLIVRYFVHKKVKIKRSIINFSGIIVIATMYIFLSSLFDIDLGTNLIVAIILFNTRINDSEMDSSTNKEIVDNGVDTFNQVESNVVTNKLTTKAEQFKNFQYEY